MSATGPLLAFAVDLFSGLGPVKARRMFGGAGLYVGEVMFGLIYDELIFLKADEALKLDFAAAGSRPWTYTRRTGPTAGVPQATSYWSLPEPAMDDPGDACAWARQDFVSGSASSSAPQAQPKTATSSPSARITSASTP